MLSAWNDSVYCTLKHVPVRRLPTDGVIWGGTTDGIWECLRHLFKTDIIFAIPFYEVSGALQLLHTSGFKDHIRIQAKWTRDKDHKNTFT